MSVTQSFEGPEGLDEEQAEAVKALLYRIGDDEFVQGDRYMDWSVIAPTLESDLSITNIAQDEMGHARLWYDLLKDFGETERTLIYDRDPDDFKHSSMLELEFEEGDWADAIVRHYFYDTAEKIRLDALEESSYRPLAGRVEKVLQEEKYHREHAQNWLKRLVSEPEGKEKVQGAVDRLFPYALTLFAPLGDIEDTIDELGLRSSSLDEMRDEWIDVVEPFLESLGINVPTADLPEPEHIGRAGTHTQDWYDQFDEITHTYEELDKPEPRRIMRDPE